MDDQAIYRKSGKGAEAIASRSLTGKLRTLLILVDGKKPVEELRRLAAGLGEAQDLLAQLAAEGYLEQVAAPAAAPMAAPAVVPVAPSAGKTVAPPASTLVPVKQLATRLLLEAIGPLAEDVCLQIEAASTLPQFVDAMKRAYSMVREVRGQAAADRFGQAVEARMPAA